MQTTVVSAYVIGFIVFAACMLLSIIISNAIPYEAGVNPQDRKKRKIWFWILAVACPILVLAIAYFAFYSDIRVPSRQNSYMVAMAISAVVSFVLYVVIGFILSKSFSHGKLSNWF